MNDHDKLVKDFQQLTEALKEWAHYEPEALKITKHSALVNCYHLEGIKATVYSTDLFHRHPQALGLLMYAIVSAAVERNANIDILACDSETMVRVALLSNSSSKIFCETHEIAAGIVSAYCAQLREVTHR